MSTSSIATISRNDLREFLLAMPNANREQIEAALQEPDAFKTMIPGVGLVGFIRRGDAYEIVEDPDHYNDGAVQPVKTGVQNMKSSSQPMLIIGPRIEVDPDAPTRPAKALTATQELLAKKGIALSPTKRGSFDPNDPADVASLVPRGYRLAETPITPALRRYIASQPDEQIAKACSEDPVFKPVASVPAVAVKTGAEPIKVPSRAAMVEESERSAAATAVKVGLQPGVVVGVMSRQEHRASVAASESQAQEVHDRVRARMATEGSMPAQRSDGSFYTETGEPNEPLSMSRRPADKDPRPGTTVTFYSPEQIAAMDPYHQRILKAAKPFRCEVCGGKGFSQNPRRFCDAHVGSGRGGEGLYDQAKK